MEIVLLIVLLAAAVFLVGAVLFRKTKDEKLSSTIVGGTETYYGKDKTGRKDKLLNKWTIIVGAVFVLVVIAVYAIQPDYAPTHPYNYWWDSFKSTLG